MLQLFLSFFMLFFILPYPAVRHVPVPIVEAENNGFAALEDCIGVKPLQEAISRMQALHPGARRLAIADFSQPSTNQRFYVIDLEKEQILLQTWVAHGKNSGDLYARKFSNTPSSLMSSQGLYEVGEKFESPRHGPSRVLLGLDKGINDNAQEREIILHGADYVGEAFIEAHGFCGRSHGCPALPRADMDRAIALLEPGSLLYIHR
jgi:hypothetical protein